MKTSESQTKLVSALLAARQSFPPIPKTKDGQSGNRHFKYAPLDDVLDAVLPGLHANGLLLTQGTDGHELVTRLDHISGEWRESRMPINAEHANMQSYGIELTYRRRYAIQPMLGIVTEEDTDGAGGQKRLKGHDYATGSHSAPRMAFESLTKDWQDYLTDLAGRLENAFEQQGAETAAQMLLDTAEADQLDPTHIAAMWSKVNSRARSAIKAVSERRHQKAA